MKRRDHEPTRVETKPRQGTEMMLRSITTGNAANESPSMEKQET
jgi:hypothetical protein